MSSNMIPVIISYIFLYFYVYSQSFVFNKLEFSLVLRMNG